MDGMQDLMSTIFSHERNDKVSQCGVKMGMEEWYLLWTKVDRVTVDGKTKLTTHGAYLLGFYHGTYPKPLFTRFSLLDELFLLTIFAIFLFFWCH